MFQTPGTVPSVARSEDYRVTSQHNLLVHGQQILYTKEAGGKYIIFFFILSNGCNVSDIVALFFGDCLEATGLNGANWRCGGA